MPPYSPGYIFLSPVCTLHGLLVGGVDCEGSVRFNGGDVCTHIVPGASHNWQCCGGFDDGSTACAAESPLSVMVSAGTLDKGCAKSMLSFITLLVLCILCCYCAKCIQCG